MTVSNWAGNQPFSAAEIQRPRSIAEVQSLVAAAETVHVVGSRHSFNAIADSPTMLSLADLPLDLVVDRQAHTVTVSTGVTYAGLAEALQPHNLAIHNTASLPHITLGGAIATGTHGSGDANGNLATAVAGLELVTASGDLRHIQRGDPDFEGLVVGLGATGAVVRLTLHVQPAFEVQQWVFERLPWESYLVNFDAITSSGYSVSLFTTWSDESIEQLWIKSRQPDPPPGFGATPATRDLHPLATMDPDNCTPQLGVPGPWGERLPHFRMGFTPSGGDELQAEYLVPRQHALPAIEAMRRLAPRIRPLLQVGELRTIAADHLWLSPQYAIDTLAIHFTWLPRQPEVESVLLEIESALAPFAARPHWGKLFQMGAPEIASLYPRHTDFVQLVQRLDPNGKFRNPWFAAHIAQIT